MKIYLIFICLILVIVGFNAIAKHFLKQRWNLWLSYGVSALGMILFMVKASTPARYESFGDFIIYYHAGSIIIRNPLTLYSSSNIIGFSNIPIIALLFTFFAELNERPAKILFTLLGGITVIASCYFIIRRTKVVGWRRIAVIGLFVINGPLYHSLWYGNLTHFVLLLLLAALFCLEKQRQFWLGILLAIAALIKLPLFLLGMYFALRKRWRVLAGFGAALLVIVGSSLLLFGFDLHIAWYHQCIQPFTGKALGTYNVQSVDGFLARLLLNTNDELRNWQPIEVGWDFKVIRYALLSLLVGTAIWICWRSKLPTTLEEENLEFCIVLCLALVISPISWTHYYLFLLLPEALHLGNRLAIPKGRLWFSLVVVSVLLTSMPVFTAEPANPIIRFLYYRLLLSHYFFGGVLLLGILLAARWRSKRFGLFQGDVIEM